MKKTIKYLLLLTAILLTFGCASREAKAFKKEYEALNGKENASGKVHRTITIKEDNPFFKVDASRIVEMIDDKETFYVYFGDPLCPWCRSVLEKAIEVAEKNKIKKIYYVKIWDDEGNEILRSKYKLNEKNKIETVVKGTDDYYKLLNSFDSLLSDYTLTDSEGKKVDTKEKRIYAPNFVYVEDGVAKKLVEGISSKQTDSRQELSEEILTDEENIFNGFFKN